MLRLDTLPAAIPGYKGLETLAKDHWSSAAEKCEAVLARQPGFIYDGYENRFQGFQSYIGTIAANLLPGDHSVEAAETIKRSVHFGLTAGEILVKYIEPDGRATPSRSNLDDQSPEQVPDYLRQAPLAYLDARSNLTFLIDNFKAVLDPDERYGRPVQQAAGLMLLQIDELRAQRFIDCKAEPIVKEFAERLKEWDGKLPEDWLRLR